MKYLHTKPKTWHNNLVRPEQRKTDLRFGTLKVRSLHRAGLLTAAAWESRYKLDLVGVQEVRWEKGSTGWAENCNFLYGKGNENHQFHLCIRRAIKQTVVTVGHIAFVNYVQILFNILLSRLTPFAEEVIGDHQCGLRNRSTADHILCIGQNLRRMGIKQSSVSALHRLQESLWFS